MVPTFINILEQLKILAVWLNQVLIKEIEKILSTNYQIIQLLLKMLEDIFILKNIKNRGIILLKQKFWIEILIIIGLNQKLKS